jgi:hypothetical protein
MIAGMEDRLSVLEGDDPVAIRWDVAAPAGTLGFQMVRESEGWTVTEDLPSAPTAMIAISMADLTRLAAGRLDGMSAFLDGRVRLSGDLMVAMALLCPARGDAPANGCDGTGRP